MPGPDWWPIRGGDIRALTPPARCVQQLQEATTLALVHETAISQQAGSTTAPGVIKNSTKNSTKSQVLKKTPQK